MGDAEDYSNDDQENQTRANNSSGQLSDREAHELEDRTQSTASVLENLQQQSEERERDICIRCVGVTTDRHIAVMEYVSLQVRGMESKARRLVYIERELQSYSDVLNIKEHDLRFMKIKLGGGSYGGLVT